jgi:hypothetical protein
MARTKTQSASEDIQILGLDAITKLLEMAQKTGKKRLKNEQIKTGLAISVGGSVKQVVVLRRRSDRCGVQVSSDRDPTDPVHAVSHCDND